MVWAISSITGADKRQGLPITQKSIWIGFLGFLHVGGKISNTDMLIIRAIPDNFIDSGFKSGCPLFFRPVSARKAIRLQR
jgi:hypothetical protein